jgi:2-oxoglutarate dehydrogenase E2 component (dihydrolipoamide succinyltransferase)
MNIEIKVPMLPESITEAQLADWHKKEGDFCYEGDVISELETDKVMLEVVATCDGRLTSIKVKKGDVVTADTVLAIITPEEGQAKDNPVKSEKVEVEKPKEVKENEEIHASPSVRREMQQKNINLEKVQPSGRGGRILSGDLHQTVSRVKMSRMRMKIAERLVDAQQTAAMLTTFNEVNMAPIMQLRSDHQASFVEKHGVKLGFMSFFVQAACHTLKQFPEVNSSIDNEDVLYHQDANIGIAVSTEKGLVVPVLRHAQKMGYADIELAIKAYAEKARSGKIELSDMTDGTFTITNGGVFGSMLSTPILNMPQSAILGMHAITKRAVVENDAVVIRPMMYLALTYDHRLIDGQGSVKFLVTLKDMLENPSKLLLDI